MQRVGGDEVVEAVGAHGAHHVGGERRFELEDAGGAAGAQLAVRGLVVEPRASTSIVDAAALLDGAHVSVMIGERGEAEEVHLEHPGLLERVHVVLRDDDAFLVPGARALGFLRADGDVVVERARRDDDAGRVHAGVAREPFERDREVEQLPVRVRPARRAWRPRGPARWPRRP
jgi:hypothetical protein